MKLEERLSSYEPLWGQWIIGERIYATSNTCVYTLYRQRNSRELNTVVKLVFVPVAEDNKNKLSEALREINIMEKLSECSNMVSIKDDITFKVYDDNDNIVGYDVLIRMDKLECLQDLIREEIVFDEDEIIKIGIDICNALSYAHKLGYLHRDVKPGNIYRTASGVYQLGDFGVTRKSSLSNELMTIVGTTVYMAPEVALGNAYDARADLYSLGMVLYQLMNGNHLPMTSEKSNFEERHNAVIRRIEGVRIPKLSKGNKKLIKCILKACHHNPIKRYQSADEFSASISDIYINKKHKRKAFIFSAIPLMIGLLLGSIIFLLLGFSDYFNLFQNHDNVKFNYKYSKYELIKSDVSWSEARKACEERGGHLITINSLDEEVEIHRILIDNHMEAVWLGATNLYTGYSFEWITREKFNFLSKYDGDIHLNGGLFLILCYDDQEGWKWTSVKDEKLSEALYSTGSGEYIYDDQEGWKWTSVKDKQLSENLYSVRSSGYICEWDDN